MIGHREVRSPGLGGPEPGLPGGGPSGPGGGDVPRRRRRRRYTPEQKTLARRGLAVERQPTAFRRAVRHRRVR